MQPLTCDLWLMDRQALSQFMSLAARFRIDSEQAKAVAAVSPKKQKNIAIIPIHGALEARPSFIGEMLGMSSYERIGNAFDSVLYDDSVSAIVLDVASPGGMVYGAQELAEKIYAGRSVKPVIAVANPVAASGAYWLATAAERVVMTPSGDVGSVGVINEHVEFTQANEREGAKVTVIRSSGSPFKAETIDSEPLSDEAKANLQVRADAIYEKFVGDLAKFRRTTPEAVKENFGKGRVVGAKQAMAAGMVDRVGTLQDTVVRLMEGRIRLGGASAEDNWEQPTRKEALRERAAALSAMATSTGEIN